MNTPAPPMPDHRAASLTASLTGILPPITTPFDESGRLIADAVKPQIDMMLAQGASAIVAGGSTGEGHTLNDTEFTELMLACNTAIAGRAPFVVGLIANSTQEVIERVRSLGDADIAALQVTPPHYLFKPGQAATLKHFETIARETAIPTIIYNVVPWNYLSIDLMCEIMDKIPGIIGIKQSNSDLKSLSDLVMRSNRANIVTSGIDAMLYPAFSFGAQGAITALTAAVPGLTVDLFRAVQDDDHATARTLHTRLNLLWNAMRHDNLPACVKYVQHLRGLELYHPRPPMDPVSAEQKAGIAQALKTIGAV